MQAKSIEDRFRELATLTKLLEEREASLQAKAKEAVVQRQRADKLDGELKANAETLKAAEKRLAETKAQASATQPEKDAAIFRLEDENGQLRDEHQAQAKSISDRFKELATLTKLLEERDCELVAKDQEIEAQKKRVAQLKETVSWKATAPLRTLARPFKRSRKESRAIKAKIALIEQSGLFDRSWYLSEYPDVAKSGADPVEHYLRYGAAEGRNPSPEFDTQWYLATYTDVAEAMSNPLVHYIKHGKKEGRALDRLRQQ